MTAGQFVPVAAIGAGNLKFVPDANENGSPYATFKFQVQDNGGTAHGGVDLDQSANTMTLHVRSVNDAPAGTDKTVTTDEDTAYTFVRGRLRVQRPERHAGEQPGAVKVARSRPMASSSSTASP